VQEKLHADIPSGVMVEKVLKALERAWNIEPIESSNPNWDHLFERKT